MTYPVDVQSLYENFPPHCVVPAILLDFGDWLLRKRAGSLAYFRLRSDRFNDYWIENGADLHESFAFFIRDPTGGQVGYWLHAGQTMASPPIVQVGSEGELNIVADSLEDFLIKLANGSTGVPDLDSRDNDTEEESGFSQWVMSRAAKTPAREFQTNPNLADWMERWARQQREWIAKDPAHLQIADNLRKYVKPNAESWETANFDVLLVGTQFRMWHRSFGPKPMPQSQVAHLEPLFRAVREQRAKKVRARGLWFSASVRIRAEGGATLCCNFMDEPKILDERPVISANDYDRDFEAFPRSKHWMPKWR